MAIEDGKDCRNWLNHPEEHMAIKEKRRMLRFQVHVFRRALYKEKETYNNLLKNTERRKKSYAPMFDTIDKLNDAYIIGQVDDKTYMSQRSKIWQVYSDRGHKANIAWLESELEHYQNRLDALEGKMEELGKESEQRYRREVQLKKHRYAYKRRRRRQLKKKELQERWRKYGIG